MVGSEWMSEPRDDQARPFFPPRATLAEIVTDTIRYWEPRRILYNVVLGAIVVGYFVAYYPASREVVTLEACLGAFFLAVLANICYCAAYLVDIFAQISDFRGLWRRMRWVLLAIGIGFAAILTRQFSEGFFQSMAMFQQIQAQADVRD
jgi:hypothetical protein